MSKAKRSPTWRGLKDVDQRVARLEAYEKWRTPMKVDFEMILGREEWEGYWKLWIDLIGEMQECQKIADDIKARILMAVRNNT